MRSGLDNDLRLLASKFSDTWAKSGTRIIGVLFYVITPAFIEDRKLLVIQQRTNGHGLAGPGSLDGRTFDALMDGLRAVWY
ncbi:MAG TPA: hypothetical protein VFB50_02020 [Chloroflexota bacterium]|nr:hypothetical protein [Chloroflexota bacterium]